MFSFLSRLTKYLDNITLWVRGIFEWNALILMILVNFEVIMRYFFKSPTVWCLDTQMFISAGGRVIAIGYATLTHGHVTMDIFTLNMSFKRSKALELFNYVIFHVPFLIALVWVTLQRGLEALMLGEHYYSVWRPPLSPLILFIVGAYALMVMQVFTEIIKGFISIKKGSDVWLKQR